MDLDSQTVQRAAALRALAEPTHYAPDALRELALPLRGADAETVLAIQLAVASAARDERALAAAEGALSGVLSAEQIATALAAVATPAAVARLEALYAGGLGGARPLLAALYARQGAALEAAARGMGARRARADERTAHLFALYELGVEKESGAEREADARRAATFARATGLGGVSEIKDTVKVDSV